MAKLNDFKQYDTVYLKRTFTAEVTYYTSQFHVDLFNKEPYFLAIIENTNVRTVDDEKRYYCFIPLLNCFYEFGENTECFKEEPNNKK